MKAKLVEKYDLELTKREMDELMTAMRVYSRAYDIPPLMEAMLVELEDVYTGGGVGLGVELPVAEEGDEDEEGGAKVAAS